MSSINESILEMNEAFLKLGKIDAKTYATIKERFPLSAQSKPMTKGEFARIRTELKLSQSALSSLCGVSISSVSKWERGESSISEPVAILMRVFSKHGIAVLN